MAFDIPDEIAEWIGSVFSNCNERITEKISNNPNTQETSLDFTLIEHLSRHSSPIAFGTDWTVRIDTHFIGGRRHFHGWEIADIGVLIFFKRNGRIVRKKVALLQSKRLYPLSGEVEEETPEDIIIGISNLMQKEPQSLPISRVVRYDFTSHSKYKALRCRDKQYSAIMNWNNETKIFVHYMFYNPWRLPFDQQVPLREYIRPEGDCELGTRVIPSAILFGSLKDRSRGYSPRVSDLMKIMPRPHSSAANMYGSRLESFFVDLLTCKEGYVFETDQEASIDRLFYRKDAMLGAAIAVTVELKG